ncbi:MAG: helix-turn-helix domain-containing protein [Solirubrobacterales bacterium]
MPEHAADHVALGKVIKEARKQRGLSQEALALEGGLDRTYVSSVERGKRNVSFNSLTALARTLNIKPSELLRRWEEIAEWDAPD